MKKLHLTSLATLGCSIIVGLTFSILCLGLSAYADNQAQNYADLEGRSLVDVLHERASTKDAGKIGKIEAFLKEKAAPKTSEDLQFVEAEIRQKEDARKRRALNWLSNIQDPSMTPQLLRFFNERAGDLPPSSVNDLVKHPEKNVEKASDQEVLGTLMLKLADLKEHSAIPLLRAYAKAESGGNIHTKVGMAAYMALARIKDEEFFGPDRRARLSAHHIDVDDPATKPWLKETMLNDPDEFIRINAGDAWAHGVANPDDPSDIEFAWKLINNPGQNITIEDRSYRRGCGFEVLKFYVNKGHFDRRIFNKAVEEAQAKYVRNGSNKFEAAQLLTMFGARSEFRAKALEMLYQLLNGPDVSARGAAQRGIGKLTGTRPHYEGEVGWPNSKH